MLLLNKLLLVYLAGLTDRFRGDKENVFSGKSVEAVIYGMVVGSLFLADVRHVLLFAVLWAVGASIGWGTPLGALLNDRKMTPGYEWWQFGMLKKSAMLACIIRGLMWGACVLPVAYFDRKAAAFVFVMPVIFPAAIILARKLPNIVNVSPWKLQELNRGWLAGLVALALNFA